MALQNTLKVWFKRINRMIKLFEEFKEEKRIKKLLSSKKVFDISFPGKPSGNGWKLSIAGKSLQDSIDLWERLHDYLVQQNIAHKFGTLKRIKHPNKEQAKKLLTIYVPNGVSINDLAPKIESKLKGYKGWQDIKTPSGYEHWGNAIFFRNDRDSQGNYIKAQNRDLYM